MKDSGDDEYPTEHHVYIASLIFTQPEQCPVCPKGHPTLWYNIKYQSGNRQSPKRQGNDKRNQGAARWFIFQHIGKEK